MRLKSTKTVLIWGFYDHGNIGDDIMAAMFASQIEAIGHRPFIYTKNSRFAELGFKTVEEFGECDPDLVLLGGGSIFLSSEKSSADSDTRFHRLCEFCETNSVPIIAASIGSDGVKCFDQLSDGRKRLFSSAMFKCAALRLRSDLTLLSAKRTYLPDIVLCTAFYRKTYAPQRTEPSEPHSVFLNLTRRAYPYAPLFLALSAIRKTCTFHSMAEPVYSTEISLPFLRKLIASDFWGTIQAISKIDTMISSKLHPGIMALSLGAGFLPVRPRAKARAFVEDGIREGIIQERRLKALPMRQYQLSEGASDPYWQACLWERYRDYLQSNIAEIQSEHEIRK